VLIFCRELLRLRRERVAHASPRYERLAAPNGVWRYAAGAVEVTANFTGQPATLPDPPHGQVLVSTGECGTAERPVLAPWEGVISARAR
jgi:hypothetical protein